MFFIKKRKAIYQRGRETERERETEFFFRIEITLFLQYFIQRIQFFIAFPKTNTISSKEGLLVRRIS